MTAFLETWLGDFLFRWYSLTWRNGLDLLAVTLTFFLLLTLLRRSQAAFLVRGVLLLAILLLITTIILPLPTFDAILGAGIIAILIALPITLQPELRQWLERLGRTAGITPSLRLDLAQRVSPRLLRAVENLAAGHTGAIIVLEGDLPLDDFIRSGVAVSGMLSAEMLQTIFHDKTPLHDGAVIVRGEHIAAAGCILPLTNQPVRVANRRLGTRHRAAVGLSEKSDALAIVVSEETGTVSLAHLGQLQTDIDSPRLRQAIYDFMTQTGLRQSVAGSPWRLNRPSLRQLLSHLTYLLMAAILALVAWVVITEQSNPTRRLRIDQVTLRLEGLPPQTTLSQPLPGSISLNIQTTADQSPTLRPESFQASVSVAGLGPGLHRLPIKVQTSAPDVRVLSALPAEVDVELSPIVTRTVSVVVTLTDQSGLSTAYEVAGPPVTNPAEVQVSGPKPLVAQVAQAQATLSLGNAVSSLSEVRSLTPTNAQGQPVAGVTLSATQARVNVTIRRRIDALDVGIRAVTSGAPLDGYWLSGLRVEPAGATLRGDPATLADLRGFVDTLPVDISTAAGELRQDVPLDLPADIQAVDTNGNVLSSVTVIVEVTPRLGDLLLTRPVQLLHSENLTITLSPAEVNLLLSGPLPTLNAIQANPELVQVTLEPRQVSPGQSQELTPTVVAPEGVTIQLIDRTIVVTRAP